MKSFSDEKSRFYANVRQNNKLKLGWLTIIVSLTLFLINLK